ncbi:MAG: NUDIX hydrolase [Anaerorhabdus sp.]|uniref:NUDIX hydrolase n=1 Tax=Anaerorhabdus sp. TaxID=1872524 RepID=UPI002FC87A10
MKGIQAIEQYIPQDHEEEKAKNIILTMAKQHKNIFTRECLEGHMTSTGFVVNESHDKVLMAFHNIYQSYSWTGGHNDGDEDWYHVAEKEVLEETGLSSVKCISPIISLDDLPVNAHIKRGLPVQAHRHYNVTYVFEASEDAPICIKEDENSALKWIPFDEIEQWVSEKEMIQVYKKIIERVKKLSLSLH